MVQYKCVFFCLYVILVDDVVLVEARIIMGRAHVCREGCVCGSGKMERNRNEFLSRVSAFKDLFASDYVL